MEQVTPKKSLGQNFLLDGNIINKIIEAVNPLPDDFIIEVGPGKGALTEILVKNDIILHSVEVDRRAFNYLSQQLKDYLGKSLFLHLYDFTKLDLNSLEPAPGKGRYKLVGNIPYNITGDIIFHIFNNSDIISEAVLMVQREVAQRLSANLSSKDYGITTVAVNYLGSCEKLFDVSPKCFYPVPNVTSSVIRMKFNEDIDLNYFRKFIAVVKSAFGMRRKTLRNSLKPYIETKTDLKIDEFINLHSLKYETELFGKRAEALSVADYESIVNLIDEVFLGENGR